jgi:glycosyltransferase involved in cell wall biosynthesis
MRIGIDARELAGRATGVGRYLAGLMREWNAHDGARRHDFVLYTPEPIGIPLDARRFATRIVAGGAGTWWEQLRVHRAIAADHLDVWFSPGYTAPLLSSVPTVVAIHDVSFAAHPEWFRLREGVRRRWLARQSAERARAVITISEFSRREIVEHLGVSDAKIHVVPPGVGTGDWGLGTKAGTASPQIPVPSPHRILFVGSVFNRRHVGDLIRAFAPIARAHADAALDLVGDNRTYPFEDLRRTIAGEGLQERVTWHDYVTDEQLGELYGRARAFAFLSEYEGLGLTPLEALAAGVPPLVLDTAVARESLGSAALYVPLNDIPAITRGLEALLFEAPARAAILAAAPDQLAKYDWPRAARDTLAVLEAAGSG